MSQKQLLKSIEELLDRKLDEKLEKKLKNFATKDDFKNFFTKDELREEFKKFAMKDDLKAFATKNDLKTFATKDDLLDLKSELKTSIDKCVTTERFEQFINDMFVPLNGTVCELISELREMKKDISRHDFQIDRLRDLITQK